MVKELTHLEKETPVTEKELTPSAKEILLMEKELTPSVKEMTPLFNNVPTTTF